MIFNYKKHVYGKILDPLSLYTHRQQARQIKSVVILLGPYRNLTTFTGALTALHPNSKVLNHAGARVLNNPNLNFLKTTDHSTLEYFKRFALYASKVGMRGKFGGNILRSHAFDQLELREAAQQASMFEKGTIQSILWKESNLLTEYIQTNTIDLDAIIKANSQIRFLFPIRNPMACAISNWNVPFKKREYYNDCQSVEDVLEQNLQYLAWFMDQRKQIPDHYYYFFEFDYDEAFLRDLCQFMDIPYSEKWGSFVLANMSTRNKYNLSDKFIQHYEELVNSFFNNFPEVKGKLLKFTE